MQNTEKHLRKNIHNLFQYAFCTKIIIINKKLAVGTNKKIIMFSFFTVGY